MNRKSSATVLSALISIFAGPAGPAQTPNTRSSDAANGRAAQEEALKLSPFEVSADSDRSYGALNSNSITRFNTALIDMPVTADVFTEAFIKDVNAASVEELVSRYTAGGGYTTNDPGSDAAALQAGDRQATSSVTVRGLMSPTLRRDAFIQLGSLTNPGSTGQGFTSNFDIERVEVINGPQSLLYGSGGSGGVLNTISKQARFNKARFGSFKFTVDKYGSKTGYFDFGVGTRRLAARVAAMDGLVAGRRVNIGGPVTGFYVQLAAKLQEHTIVRLTASQTEYDRLYNANLTLNAGNATLDARHGQNLKYLIASNQVQASASGASGAGPLLGGHLNWNNADSFAGWNRTERSKNEYITLTAESKWTRWLSTDLSVGYNNFEDRLVSSAGGAFLSPTNPTNTLREWASSKTGNTNWKPTRTTAARFAAVASHSLFGASSQSMFGTDYNRSKQTSVQANLYRADANWNLIGDQLTGVGRQVMSAQLYSIAGGPGNPYYAQPENITGRIAPTSAAARVLLVTDPVRGSILTGETGLPISALQINPGFTPPGKVATIVAGEKTTGYGEYSFNYTSMYHFSSGWMKGLRTGGNLALDWRNRAFYYYPNGTAGGNPKREAFYWPNTRRVSLILGYDFRFSRYGFSTQLNINNLFNRYDVIITPNNITGWSGVKNATFFQEPRNFVWTNTLSF